MFRSVALVLLSGCSLVFVDGPPSQPPPPPAIAQCDTSRIPPAIDTVIAVLAATGAIYFAQSDDDMAGVGVVVEGGLALGFGLSALTGYRRTGRCAAMQGR
ncbi:MAG: hypothetical protein SFX73_21890 [Kofleriaceae bacterium]|nr:hypothetical protein [Kofleriaceae bacterium]